MNDAVGPGSTGGEPSTSLSQPSSLATSPRSWSDTAFAVALLGATVLCAKWNLCDRWVLATVLTGLAAGVDPRRLLGKLLTKE